MHKRIHILSDPGSRRMFTESDPVGYGGYLDRGIRRLHSCASEKR